MYLSIKIYIVHTSVGELCLKGVSCVEGGGDVDVFDTPLCHPRGTSQEVV